MRPDPYINDIDDDEPTFIKRYRIIPCAVGLFIVMGVVMGIRTFASHGGAAPHHESLTMVNIAPLPPPPPPPPPPPEQPQEQKMIDQEPLDADKPKEDDKPPPEPQAVLGTNIKGDGPGDSFGLSSSGDRGFLGGNNSSANTGSRFGWYAGQVQARIVDALRKNVLTRSASLQVDVRIWPDLTGRITRAKLASSTGDPKVDNAIQNEVLTGLQLQEPPPEGMPTPIVLRLNARRPN